MIQIDLEQVMDLMKEISEDTTLPRNVKAKMGEIMEMLSEQADDVSLRINKAMHELEGIVDDKNLQAYYRTQLFNVISMLDSI